jgi:formylglycine-generating enzyme required for sulfatase activity
MKKESAPVFIVFFFILPGCQQPLPAFPEAFQNAGRSSPQAQIPAGSRRLSAKDGAWMVFVPEGRFWMGSDAGPEYEQPSHSVWVDAFWMDRTEVTNAQYAAFVRETGFTTDAESAGWSYVYDPDSGKWIRMNGADWRHPGGPATGVEALAEYPAAYMSWNDAQAYCRWAGRRLPTEAEWEKAARGTDGRTYPWGNRPPDGALLNFADRNINLDWADPQADDGYAFSSPVGSYPDGASPYGALDLAGNVWEWVQDWFDFHYYRERTDWINPTGPSARAGRVLRGGSWADSARVTRATYRLGYYPMDGYAYYGFRCAMSLK